MFKYVGLFAGLAATVSTDVISEISDISDETGEIMLWSDSAVGFNNYEERAGNLDDLACYIDNTYYGNCQSTLAKNTRTGKATVNRPLIVAYFIDEVYDHEDLFAVKQQYGVSDYKYIEVLGISLDTGSQFYHRLKSQMKASRYRLEANDFDTFKEDLKLYTKMALVEVDTISTALQVSQQVTDYIHKENPENTLISVIAPSKAELAAMEGIELNRRRLLRTYYNWTGCNGSDGDYCLDYWCNRTTWDTAAYSDSCINQYELFGLTLLITIFLPFCCIGCCCMDGIRTPLRFPTRVLPVRKEF